MTVVRAEAAVAARPRRDIDVSRNTRIERAAVANNLDRLIFKGLVGGRVAEPWRGSRIERQTIGGSTRQGKTHDATPLRADELLHAIDHRDAVLRDHVLQLERLPSVRVGHRRTWLVD